MQYINFMDSNPINLRILDNLKRSTPNLSKYFKGTNRKLFKLEYQVKDVSVITERNIEENGSKRSNPKYFTVIMKKDQGRNIYLTGYKTDSFEKALRLHHGLVDYIQRSEEKWKYLLHVVNIFMIEFQR